MSGLLQLLALGLLLAIILVTWLTMRRLRNPPRRTYAWAVARNRPGDPSELDDPRDFTTFEIMAASHRCSAWDIPGDSPSGPLIITTPGWGDSKIGVLPRLDAILPHAARVIAWDPPGSGDTPGLCPVGTREPRMLLDIARELHEPGRKTALLGWSLGAGISIAAASLDASSGDSPPLIDAVIAEAPYRFPWVPAFNVMRRSALPWRINGPFAFALLGIRLTGSPLWKGFDRAAHAATARCPILLLHGTDDEVSPFADSQSLAQVAPNATLVPVVGATHNNLWTDDPFRTDASAAITDLLTSLAHPPATPTPRQGVH